MLPMPFAIFLCSCELTLQQAATDAPVTATVSGAASTMFSGVLVLGAALLAAVNMM